MLDLARLEAYRPADGRKRRSYEMHARILAACRAMMKEGTLQPSVGQVAARAGVSIRSVHQHFQTVEVLRDTAIADCKTDLAVSSLILGKDWGAIDGPLRRRLVYIAIHGRLP